MASNDDNLFSADAPTVPTDGPQDETASGAQVPAAAEEAGQKPAKRAARKTAKRAPRKATAKATAAAEAPEADAAPHGEAARQGDAAPLGQADEAAAPGEAPAAESQPKAPAKKAAKRAPRKSARKAAAPATAEVPAEAPEEPAAEAPVEPAVEAPEEAAAELLPEEAAAEEEASEAAQTPAVPSFGVLFQAPEPTVAPRRRRATAPVTAPAAEPEEAAAEAAEEEAAQAEAEQGGGQPPEGGARKRRRRGGKGRRGRPNEAEQGEEAAGETPEKAEAAAAQGERPEAAEAEEEAGEGGTTRRRRRRRRSGSAAAEGEEAPGTVTRVREPRKDRDEVTSLKGSTRLEAKKQRRREGREAGRRRTIITEAEFLARRESVERVMVVRHKDDRTQIGVLEDGVLVEHYVSRETNGSMAGNVYLGRIQNVLPSMEAAFVDIGKGRNAVLYAGEVNWDAAGLENNRARRIENALSSGGSVLVQVTKDPIGHKGARLTSQVSLPGRYLVYVPDGNMTGISRKLPDTERARLKKILREVVPENAGVIVRTAAEGASEDELRADVARLTAEWEAIQAKAKSASAPALLHGEPDLTVRVIRDVFNEDFSGLVVSGEPAWSEVSDYIGSVAPDLADRVTRWTSEEDLFTHYRVDEQLAKAMDRKVWLPSGGSLVIDRTEAMTVVDVNTGKFVGSGGNLEETVTKNNIEAAEEIVRQLRLRDIGGIIVIDFIDMVLESNRDLVVRRLLECLGRDRTKHQVAEVTSLGLVQMTRKRVGTGLIEVFSETCEHCAGRGIIVHAEPVDKPAGNGGGDTGGSSAGRNNRSRRGKGGGRESAPAAPPAAAPAPAQVHGGPTPAQIAAAAHAAALQAATHAEGAEPLLTEDAQAPSQDQPELEVREVELSEQPEPEAAVPATEETPAPAAEAPAGVAAAAPEAEAATQAPARGRRRRGRVVAPAGPPRGAADAQAPGQGAEQAGEFAAHGADQVP